MFCGVDNNQWCVKSTLSLTCEMLIFDPFDPAVTMTLKLLKSDRLLWAELPVLSRASFRIRFTWFSNVCLSVLPGDGSSSLLCAFLITSMTSLCVTGHVTVM